MEDFVGLLQRDFGLKPQGKSSPMVSSKSPDGGSIGRSSSAGNVALPPPGGSAVAGDDPFFSKSSRGFDEVFGGSAGTKSQNPSVFSSSPAVYDNIFKAPAAVPTAVNGGSFSAAAADAPIFDDDIFGGVPGVRKVNSSGIDDIFGRSSSLSPSPFDDLLGGFGASAKAPKQTSKPPMESFDDLLPGFGGMDPPKHRPAGGDGKSSEEFASKPASAGAFDDLLPGFGSSDPPPQPRPTGDAKKLPEQTSSPFVDSDPNPYKENGKSNTVKMGLGGGERAEEGLPGFDEFMTSPPPPTMKPSVVAPSSKGSENPKKRSETVESPSRSSPQSETLLNRNIAEKKRGETVESPSRSSPRKETLLNRNIVEKRRGETVESPSRSSAQSDTLLNRNIVEKKRGETVESPSRSSTRSETLLNRNIVEKKRSETVISPSSSTTRNENASEAKIEMERVSNNNNNNNEVRSPKMERTSQVASPRKKDRKSEESANQARKVEKKRMGRDYWVSVENIKLATQPSSAPPPTRPLPLPKRNPAKNLAAFGAGMPRKPGEDGELEGIASASAAAASAAAMKEAMDKAEAKAKQAKEREREAKLVRAKEERERLREAQLREEEQREKDERAFKERWEREEALAREREEREVREEEREARERQRKEQLEKEREKEKERERRAVEKVNQEARERAAAEAQERMERVAKEARERAERVAVERATVEARGRAANDAKERAAESKARLERAAVERANAEARERAAAEARERAERIAAERAAAAVERANAEARERAAAEARERAERIAAERAAAAVERANAEARERAAAEARERAERAAAAAKENQRRQQDNDLESFFKSNSRADSAPRQRPAAAVPTPDIPQPNRGFQSDGNRRPPPAPSEVKKPPVSPIDDLTSLFGAARPSEDFQEVAGETAERRKARLERHQRTLDRTAKALEEKNQRDLQVQREQAERHRLSETVDAEIKRWSLGKEGNIRALLSTLQYVLWPECGWQPVSLTDLITGASVKKVYRKATLCVHPDKVQQKGATIQQKYISEKVFDLLKEAWNKFNSEELF